MKKGLFGCFGCLGIVVVIIVIIAVIAAVTGGGDSSSSNSDKAKTTKIGEPVKVDKLEYKVNSIETADSVGNEYVSSTADGKYIVADVTVKNNGDKAITIDTELFKLLNGSKTSGADASASSDANVSNSDPSDIGFFLEKLNPDNEKTGKVVFDVSEETAQSDKLKLQVQSGFFGNQKANIDVN